MPAHRKRRTGRWGVVFTPATGPKSFERLTPHQQRQTIRAARVAARAAERGEVLRAAARAEHMDPRTVLKYLPGGFEKVGGRWRAAPPGRSRGFIGHMEMLSDQGRVEVAPATRRQRQLIGAHWEWVRDVIVGAVTGETPPLPAGLRETSIRGRFFDVDPASVLDWWMDGALDDLDDIYVRPEGVAG